MELAAIPRISLYASFLALTACGGGGSSGGSDGSSARSTYTGPVSYASLNEDNRDELVFKTYQRLSAGLVSEELGYDDVFAEGMGALFASQQRSAEASDSCDSGKFDLSASANESFTAYTFSLNYKKCTIDSATANGKFSGDVRLSSPGSSLYWANYISVQYDDFRTSEGSSALLLSGKETKTKNDSANNYTISQNILVEQSHAGATTQDFYDKISMTRNNSFNYNDPINMVSLSGAYYHSSFGRVDLSVESSDQFDGNKVILSGSNSTIVIDYIEAMASYEISVDTNNDGIFESQETGVSVASIID